MFMKPKNAEYNQDDSYSLRLLRSSTEIRKSFRLIINRVSIERLLLLGSNYQLNQDLQ